MKTLINKIFEQVDLLIPNYLAIPEDAQISNGNLAVCIIDEEGNVYGKMFGSVKPRLRQSYKVAWIKASQVWLTGVSTGEYEKMVFNQEIEENANGIEAPDLIGWVGGQPLITKSGKTLAIGFSGFRGVTDILIMKKAFSIAEQLINQ
jgi:uncharacterized protein GlcG (DUF336 family)